MRHNRAQLVPSSLVVSASSPAPHIVWRKIGATDLPASAQVSMSGALLHLYNVQYEDSAGYECEAINQKWQDWHQAWLYVEGKIPDSISTVLQ